MVIKLFLILCCNSTAFARQEKTTSNIHSKTSLMSFLYLEYKLTKFLHFHKIPIFEHDVRIIFKRWIMADTVIYWDTCGESNACNISINHCQQWKTICFLKHNIAFMQVEIRLILWSCSVLTSWMIEQEKLPELPTYLSWGT